MMRFLEPDDARRARFGVWFFRRTLEYGVRYGAVYSDPDARGAAVWLPPGQTDMSFWRTARSGFMTLPFRLGLQGMGRFNQIDRTFGRWHKQLMKQKHWYLLTLGVAPASQAQGIGTALIEQVTPRADGAGLPCYLETTTPENVVYYGRRGFEVVREGTVAGEFYGWAMLRRPATR